MSWPGRGRRGWNDRMPKEEIQTQKPKSELPVSFVSPGSLRISGSLTRDTVAGLWRRADIPTGVDGRVVLDASGVTACDSAGLALLVMLNGKVRDAGLALEVSGLPVETMALYGAMLSGRVEAPAKKRPAPFFESVGRAVVKGFGDGMELLSFLGEISVHFCRAVVHPGRVRWADWARVLETSGVNAVPVVLVIGFLLGLILAFQSAVPLKMFGAEIYVANLIGIAVIRELGTLVAAIAMAGRTASAFAAEIGTMTVNEEISALRTMGIEPVRFLALPRVLAVMVVLPLLSLFADLAGLAGGFVVIRSMGYSLEAYVSHVIEFTSPGDLYGSLAKALVFGALVAGVGCLRGLQTGRSADAVGRSATSAVVSAIVAVALADGLFAVVFYCLGI